MKCPLFTVGGYDNDHLPRFGWNDCLKEECAWWDSLSKSCHLATIADHLAALHFYLKDIRDKMPHERSYVK